MSDADGQEHGHDGHGDIVVHRGVDFLRQPSRDDVGQDTCHLPENSYGDVILSLVDMVDRCEAGAATKKACVWLGASCFLLVASVALQFLTRFGLLATSIHRSQRPFADGRAWEMAAALNDAVVEGTPLEKGSAARTICDRNDVSIVPTYFLILVVWVLHVTGELSHAAWLMIVMQRVALSVQAGELSLQAGEEGSDADSAQGVESESSECSRYRAGLVRKYTESGTSSYQIQFLTPRLKRLCFCVTIANVLVTIWVLWVGTNFLVYSHLTKVLVLKTMVCSFFLRIGDNLLKWLMSEAKLARLRRTSVRFRGIKSEDWSNYGSTLVRLCLVVLMAGALWFGLFRSLRAFRYNCQAYKAMFEASDDLDPDVYLWEDLADFF